MYKQRVRPDGGIPPGYSGWTAIRDRPCPDPPPGPPPPARPGAGAPEREKAPCRCEKRSPLPFFADSGDLILAAALVILLFCGEEKPDLLTLGAILVLFLLR